MKIDESCINHNAVRLIDGSWENISGLEGEGEALQIMTLGYIKGITDMAKALKEVLKA